MKISRSFWTHTRYDHSSSVCSPLVRPVAEPHAENPRKYGSSIDGPLLFFQICIAAKTINKKETSSGTSPVTGGDAAFQRARGWWVGGGACSSVMHEGSQSGDGPHPPAVHRQRSARPQKVTARLPQPLSTFVAANVWLCVWIGVFFLIPFSVFSYR